MKKRRDSGVSTSIIGFLLFFATIGVTSTASIFVYYFARKTGNEFVVVSSVLVTIIIGAVLCSLADVIRRRIMIEKPTEKILEATKRIAAGDFNVRLEPRHEYSKYDEYDLIYQNINTLTKELSKNEVLRTDFISSVSHEIKTPLAVIRNYAKALQNENLQKEKKQEFLNGLIIQTQKLSELITNILKLNKLENQQIVPEIEKFDLAELVRMSALSFESLLEKKNIQLECDIDDMNIISSATLIELVINNLISNAIKFTDNGGKVLISLKEDGDNVVISVSDTGCGISKEVGEHIFDKFFQGDCSRSTEGNGLGLALVKKVIDVIGGQISVESVVGKGSTFTIKLKKE